MAFQKGHKKLGGRQPGSPNKVSKSAREAFTLAFEAIGGADALGKWARDNRTAFYQLYGRLIPVDVSGEGGEAVPVKVIHEYLKSPAK